MQKILIVMYSLYNGGAEKSLVNFLNEIEQGKYEIDLLLFKKEGLFLSQVPKWVHLIDTPEDIKCLYKSSQSKKFKLSTKVIRYLGSSIAKLATRNSKKSKAFRWKYFYSQAISPLSAQYDVALAYISGEILYFVSEKVQANRKIIWIHNDYRKAGHPKKYDLPHLGKMDVIVSISDICVDILKEEFPQLADKIICLPNITSSKVINHRASEFIPEEYDVNKLIILSIGRLTYQKGFDTAVDAAKIMKSKKLKFVWYIIGDGEEKIKLEKRIKANGVEDCVKLLGVKENPYPYIANCGIFVQPSRFEGKSVVLDEAKILGKAILATEYQTVGDQLVNGREGVICEMNPKDIAGHIEKLIRHPEIIERCISYLNQQSYGNQSDIQKYYRIIENPGLSENENVES